MSIPGTKFRDAIFVIVEERSCPFYNIGDELKVEHLGFSVPSHKPVCLNLSQKIVDIVNPKNRFGAFQKVGGQKPRLDCGGCEGIIRFEYKKERDFSTVHMQLLNVTEERRNRHHLEKFFRILRAFDIFEPLDDDALSDLTLLLELRKIQPGKVVLSKGETGQHLYILLKGLVKVIDSHGLTIAEMGGGKIFGEMSLISGEPVTNSIHTLAATQVAMLSLKNFRYVLKKYPLLQLFFFKLMVDRAQIMTLRSGKITSGMTGKLEEISATSLFKILNTSRKTGFIDLVHDKGKARVVFHDGEIIHARYLDLRDKEAFLSLCALKNGHFTYKQGLPTELESLQPIGSFKEMIR